MNTYTDKYWSETPIGPSMDVIRARHRACVTRKCSCGPKRDPEKKSNGLGRTWLACLRCLGTIKQLS